MYTDTYIFIYTHYVSLPFLCIYTHYIYMYMCVCAYVYMYIYIYIHKKRGGIYDTS